MSPFQVLGHQSSPQPIIKHSSEVNATILRAVTQGYSTHVPTHRPIAIVRCPLLFYVNLPLVSLPPLIDNVNNE